MLPTYRSKTLTMAADIRLAIVPASIARNPSRARSFLRFGASAPMPPICIPMELKFANPHRANVAIVKDRKSSEDFCAPSSDVGDQLVGHRARAQQIADLVGAYAKGLQ